MVFGPVHEVGRRKCVEKYLVFVRGRECRVDPVMLVEYNSFRVSIPAGKNRVS
jgi:hypothetical protein